MDEQLEQAQLELLQSGKVAQEKTIDILVINAKIKCYELAVKKVGVMNHSGTMSYHRVADEVDTHYKKIAKTVGVDLK